MTKQIGLIVTCIQKASPAIVREIKSKGFHKQQNGVWIHFCSIKENFLDTTSFKAKGYARSFWVGDSVDNQNISNVMHFYKK